MAFPYHKPFPEPRSSGKDNFSGFFETKASREARVGRLLESVRASSEWKRAEDFMKSKKWSFRLTTFRDEDGMMPFGDGPYDYPYVVVNADFPAIAMGIDSTRLRNFDEGGKPVVAIPLNVFEYVVEFLKESYRIEELLKKA